MLRELISKFKSIFGKKRHSRIRNVTQETLDQGYSGYVIFCDDGEQDTGHVEYVRQDGTRTLEPPKYE